MYVSAELARFCPTTALTYNMHSQTVLWTGILADDLDMPPEVRERHERIRARALPLDPRGRRDHEPAALGGHRARRDRRRRDDGDARARRLRDQRAQGLRVARGRRARLQLHLPRRGRGGPALPLGALRQPRRARSSATGTRSACAAPTRARCVFKDAFVAADDELLPTGLFDQLAARWPHVYLTLTPTYVGLTRAVVDFVQGYLGSKPPPGIPARRDVRRQAVGLGGDPDRLRAQPLALGVRRRRGGARPDARSAAARLGGVVHGHGDRARGGRARDPRLRRRLADAQPAARAALPRRALRLGDAALERRGVPRAARAASASTGSSKITVMSELRGRRRARPWPGARRDPGRSCCSCTASA